MQQTEHRKQATFIKVLLTALLISVMIAVSACGSGSDSSSSAAESSAGSSAEGASASSVTYNYVSPSDLSGSSSESDSDNSSDSDQGSQEQSGEGGPGGAPGGAPGGPNTQSYDYSGTYTAALTADGNEKTSDGEELSATESDQNVALAQNGGVLELLKATLTKSGSDDDGDRCNFYGANSSVLAVGEKTKAYISKSNISSTSDGSNGIFATDSATVYASGTSIKTTDSDNARGLDATYGGVIYGDDLEISTEGDHCAATATDRGGGYISLTDSTLSTKGSGSPLIYSTGDIEVSNVTGTASGSQIAGMEGLNRIIISNSTLESTNDATTGSDPIKNGIIIYQSTSGDADTSTDETADFEAIDSTLKTSISDGAMFYVTNTNAKIVLSNTDLDFDTENVDLIDAVGNSSNNWGSEGSNGGSASITASEQVLGGDIKVDSISSVSLSLTNGSIYTGAVKGDVSDDNVTINVSENSQWTVTKDCTVSSLDVAEGGEVVDSDGKTVTIKSGSETLVKGDSDITVTVTGDYTTDGKAKNETVSVDVLDRADFDKKYETETAFGKTK